MILFGRSRFVILFSRSRFVILFGRRFSVNGRRFVSRSRLVIGLGVMTVMVGASGQQREQDHCVKKCFHKIFSFC